MASCLVPNFPAVAVALEHIKELDWQLKEDGGAFSAAAGVHLMEISAAVTELEAEWRAAHEHLEAESTENSNLSRRVSDLREQMSQEVMVEVAAARAVNVEEMEQLCKDLREVSQLLLFTTEKQEALVSQNKELCPERELIKAEHDEVVAALDTQITFKCALQEKLEQTLGQTEELKRCIAAVELEKGRHEQSIALARQEFTVKQEKLSKEVEAVEGQIKKQKRAVRRTRRELDRVEEKKQEACHRLSEIELQADMLQSSLQTMSASRYQSKVQLEMERQKQVQLKQQRETLKKERHQLREAFKDSMRHLEEEISRVEGGIEKVEPSARQHHDSLAQVAKKFTSQQSIESQVRAEHVQVSQQLEHSERLLEEQICSLVKHRQEISEMDDRLAKLLEVDTISKLTYERECKEICRSVDAVARNTRHHEEERNQLRNLLVEVKKEQAEHEARMNLEIGHSRRRHLELQREEAEYLRQEPRSADAEAFLCYIQRHEIELKQEEDGHQEEIEQANIQIESWMRSNKEKTSRLQKEEERLKKAEAMWSEEEERYERVREQATKLMEQRNHLEVSIQHLKEKTEEQLRLKEEAKAALEEMERDLVASLEELAGELRAAEVAIYDGAVKLQQVEVENSRLHLQIAQMSAGLQEATEHRERYREDAWRCRRSVEELAVRLRKAWREDMQATHEGQRSSQEELRLLGETRSRLNSKRERLDSVGALLHLQVTEVSRRLGGRVLAGHRRASADL